MERGTYKDQLISGENSGLATWFASEIDRSLAFQGVDLCQDHERNFGNLKLDFIFPCSGETLYQKIKE